MKRVLILCTGNSCRSQMAQVIWQRLADGNWRADSAGSRPAGFVHPMAIAALEEIGLATDRLSSKSIELFLDEPIDLAISVCDNAKDDCPTLPMAKEIQHWPFDDPACASGPDEQKMAEFRRIRDQIHLRIAAYLERQASS